MVFKDIQNSKSLFKLYLENEVYCGEKLSFIKKIQRRYITPNTNFVFLARKMWMHRTIGGGYHKFLAKLYYSRIYHRYGCCLFLDADIGLGLKVPHPVGIVIGRCSVGRNLTVLQGVTIGEKNLGEWSKDHNNLPKIGDNVVLSANVCVLGNVKIGENIVVGANSIVCRDIIEQGVYAGIPASKIK